jgi:hypothetical protein
MRNISATIVADVKRFSHQINTDEVFDTHSGILFFKSALGLEERGNQVKDEEYQRDHRGRR